MTRFLLSRHGETDWNAEGRVQGGGSLNARGRAQVEALARRLQQMGNIAAILSSPTERTLETAAVLSRAVPLPIERRDGLRDISYGRWAGAKLEDARREAPDLFQQWAEAPHTVRFPGGEALGDLRARVLAVAREAQERFPDGTVLVVTHDSPIRIVVCYTLGLDDSRHLHVKLDVASLTIVDLGQDRSVLVTMNDTCHLRDLHAPP